MAVRSPAYAALLGGVIGPPVFVLVFLIDDRIHPAYDPVANHISELMRGELGWLQAANFLVFAAAMLTFAAGIYWGAPRRRASAAGSVLFAAIGAGLIVSGLFVPDAQTGRVQTLPGIIHNVAAFPVFLGLFGASLVFSLRFRGGLRIYSAASGALFLLVMFVASHFSELHIDGVFQRISIVVGWTWITVLAFALRAEHA